MGWPRAHVTITVGLILLAALALVLAAGFDPLPLIAEWLKGE